jgi:hypothetical protein
MRSIEDKVSGLQGTREDLANKFREFSSAANLLGLDGMGREIDSYADRIDHLIEDCLYEFYGEQDKPKPSSCCSGPFCENCGDCVSCHGEDPCPASRDGKHSVIRILPIAPVIPIVNPTPLTTPILEAMKLPTAEELEGKRISLTKSIEIKNPFELVLGGRVSRVYDIWSEGFRASGDHGTAQCLGTEVARSFSEACWKFFVLKASENDPSRCYDFERNTYWDCRLFDNEEAARATFG